MSEAERRRNYRYNRVLIETERILDPQFDDAVVFLSGAQIEMLRNVTQYLNRLDTYVSEQFLGYYLAPTTEEYDEILEIVADLEETLMGNPNTIWGYLDRWSEYKSGTSTGEWYTDISMDAVPAGEVWVLEQWNILQLGDQACGVILGAGAAGDAPMLYDAPAVPHNDWIYGSANMTFKEDDYLTLRVTGLPDTKQANFRVWGHKMQVPE